MRALLAAVDSGPAGTDTDEICRRLDESRQRLADVFEFLKEKRILLGFGGVWFHPDGYLEAADRFCATLAELHQHDASRGTLPPIHVVRTMGATWPHKAVRAIARDLIAWGRVKGNEDGVRMPDFRPTLTVRQQVALERIAAILDASGYVPLGLTPLARAANLPTQALSEALRVGEYLDLVVPVSEGFWMTPARVEEAFERFASLPQPFAVSQARDALEASRRVAHALLLHLQREFRATVEEDGWRVHDRRPPG